MGCIGVFVPFLARWLDRLWMRFSNILGMIFPKITLTLLFFFVLYPIAILSTIFSKKRPLLLKNPRGSTFIEVNKSFNANFFEKPW
jgi:ABC-type dipeptide/oligopeptide/nickel transport system permease subunit